MTLAAVALEQRSVQSPAPAAFVCKRELIAPFDARPLLGIKALVDDDSAALQSHRAEYVRLTTKKSTARNP